MRKQKMVVGSGSLFGLLRLCSKKAGVLLLTVLPLTPANRLFGQKIDRPAVSHLLDSIHHEDQLNRDRLVAMDQNWNDSLQESYDALWATQKQIDRHNMLAIEDLHNKYGWDTLMTLPDTAKLVIFLVIQHSDSLHMVKYLPLLNPSCAL